MQAILNQGGLIASLNGEKEESESAAVTADEAKHGMTIAEKIIARAAGLSQVKAGDIATVTLDRLMSNDGTTHLTIGMYEKLKNPHIADKDKLVWIVDHNIPSDSPKTAASQKKMRDLPRLMILSSTRVRAYVIRL